MAAISAYVGAPVTSELSRISVRGCQSKHVPCRNLVLAPSSAVPLRSSFGQIMGSQGCRRRNICTPRASAEQEEETPSEPVEQPISKISKNSDIRVSGGSKKQRIMLRFLWLEKNVGIALDQLIPGQGTVPLSPYMFWPRKDAWEQLKELLDSKPWISRKRTIILLNQATDIINLWQQTTFKP